VGDGYGEYPRPNGRGDFAAAIAISNPKAKSENQNEPAVGFERTTFSLQIIFLSCLDL
jgi:hypothetical protein